MTNAAKKAVKADAAEFAAMSEAMTDKVATFAGQSLDKAQETVNKATEAAHGNVQMFDAAAGAMRSGLVEMQLKAIEIAQANTDAAFALVRDLLAVRDPQGLVKTNVDFVSRQSAEVTRQVREINELAAKYARETSKPAQDGLARSFAELTKNFAA